MDICPVKKLSSYLSEARCKWFALWSNWCHCNPIISAV